MRSHVVRRVPSLAVCLFVLVAVAGCATVADFLAATKPLIDAVGPTVSDIVINSLSNTVADAIDQAAAGSPMGPEERQILADTLSGGFREAFTEFSKTHAAGGSAWDSFMAGVSGGLSGGVTAGGASWVAIRKAKAGEAA